MTVPTSSARIPVALAAVAVVHGDLAGQVGVVDDPDAEVHVSATSSSPVSPGGRSTPADSMVPVPQSWA